VKTLSNVSKRPHHVLSDDALNSANSHVKISFASGAALTFDNAFTTVPARGAFHRAAKWHLNC
jgi:hypothetical protein